MYNVQLEQDKSSDIEQQPSFGEHLDLCSYHYVTVVWTLCKMIEYNQNKKRDSAHFKI